MADIHPGSFVGDGVEEFKKLPKWGKFAAIGVLILVAYLAWRARSSSTTAQKAAASTAGTDPLGSSGAATAGTQSPFPMVGSLPVLPNNINPLFDSSGNPIAYQSAPAPTVPSSPTTPTNPTNAPSSPLVPYAGSVPSQAGAKFNYNGQNYVIDPGAGGRVWGWTGASKGQGQQVLLHAPASYYHGDGGQGDGGFSMFSFMENPLVYLVSAKPHTPSSVPGR